jgi:hypothetical protein
MHIYQNFPYTELEEIRMSDLMLTFSTFKHFDLVYRRVGAGAGARAGAALKFTPRVRAA